MGIGVGHTLASKVFSVSSLRYELPCDLVGKVYTGKRQRPPLFQDLSSDEYIFSHLGSIHVPARHWIERYPRQIKLFFDLVNILRVTLGEKLYSLTLSQADTTHFSGVLFLWKCIFPVLNWGCGHSWGHWNHVLHWFLLHFGAGLHHQTKMLIIFRVNISIFACF